MDMPRPESGISHAPPSAARFARASAPSPVPLPLSLLLPLPTRSASPSPPFSPPRPPGQRRVVIGRGAGLRDSRDVGRAGTPAAGVPRRKLGQPSLVRATARRRHGAGRATPPTPPCPRPHPDARAQDVDDRGPPGAGRVGNAPRREASARSRCLVAISTRAGAPCRYRASARREQKRDGLRCRRRRAACPNNIAKRCRGLGVVRRVGPRQRTPNGGSQGSAADHCRATQRNAGWRLQTSSTRSATLVPGDARGGWLWAGERAGGPSLGRAGAKRVLGEGPRPGRPFPLERARACEQVAGSEERGSRARSHAPPLPLARSLGRPQSQLCDRQRSRIRPDAPRISLGGRPARNHGVGQACRRLGAGRRG